MRKFLCTIVIVLAIAGAAFPASKEEMDELFNQAREEIDLKNLDAVAGGDSGSGNPPTPWICPFCGSNTVIPDSPVYPLKKDFLES